ncbi:carbonic anhydrase-like protein 2 [Leptotrombidium deliense]|uniref:Carbonic anhydrase n=1 Tax=Leptotrombidium deliense TaxID=299467 RepID=A0A443SMD5_9ACAR|nr:carbonic anhydrase-like protein 2 [Leptotrombidium deliense]
MGICMETAGPITWANKYPIATAGKRQSPIDIATAACSSSVESKCNKPLELKYPLDMNNLPMINIGNGWRVDIPDEFANETILKGGPLKHNYKLAQFHCHWGKDCNVGSEHTVDGKYYAAELHFVHWNCDLFSNFKEALKEANGLAVLGVFLESANVQHNELDKITSKLKDIPFKGQQTEIPQICVENFLPESKSFWTYDGSLTTPPLYESVTWIVFKQPIHVHENQVGDFREMFHTTKDCDLPLKVIENYRPVQALCGRSVAFVESA